MTSNGFSLKFESDTITEKKQKKHQTFIKSQKQGTDEEAWHYLHLSLSLSLHQQSTYLFIAQAASTSFKQHGHCDPYCIFAYFHMQLFRF